jgi:hypothetical protein
MDCRELCVVGVRMAAQCVGVNSIDDLVRSCWDVAVGFAVLCLFSCLCADSSWCIVRVCSKMFQVGAQCRCIVDNGAVQAAARVAASHDRGFQNVGRHEFLQDHVGNDHHCSQLTQKHQGVHHIRVEPTTAGKHTNFQT